MKKIIAAYLGLALLFVLVGCNSKSPNKDVQKIIDRIVELKQPKEEEKFKETEFSFKIFYDEAAEKYIVDVWSPIVYEGKKEDTESVYYYKNDDIDRADTVNDLSKMLNEGNYKEVYKSGKFDK
jgi:predicted small lipoprotein YifL